MDKLIHSYFKKGEEQGFSKEYVRDTLIKKGYDPVRVRLIYNSLKSKPSHPKAHSPKPSSHVKTSSYHHKKSATKWPIALFVAIAILFFIGSIVFFIYAGQRVPSDALIIDEEKTRSAQAVLDDILERDGEIEEKSRMIREQLDHIEKLELSNEEKVQLIGRQLYEIQELHQSIEGQREEIHALLWGLMKDILQKGQPSVDPRYE